MTNRTIILGGKNVALAAMTLADQPQFHAWLQDSELRDLIDDQRIPTVRDQTLWFERVQKPDRKFFSLVTVPEGALIGNAGFVDIDSKLSEATLRITIGHPEFRGKGLGSEAVSLLVAYAFEIAKWKQINLKVLKTNERAIRSYEKSGFKIASEHLQDGRTVFTMTLDSPRA
jgi:RimJ/RimL family protein N-acetyltransferase